MERDAIAHQLGIKDTEVLELAVKNNAVLITEDKDFDKLAFRLKFQHNGILLIRLSDLPRKERLLLAVNTICKNMDKLNDNFSVLSKNGLRIKQLTGKNMQLPIHQKLKILFQAVIIKIAYK